MNNENMKTGRKELQRNIGAPSSEEYTDYLKRMEDEQKRHDLTVEENNTRRRRSEERKDIAYMEHLDKMHAQQKRHIDLIEEDMSRTRRCQRCHKDAERYLIDEKFRLCYTCACEYAALKRLHQTEKAEMDQQHTVEILSFMEDES